jgi:hypothetical protein
MPAQPHCSRDRVVRRLLRRIAVLYNRLGTHDLPDRP